jgi:hypothetical protein
MSTDLKPDGAIPLCRHCDKSMIRHSSQKVEGHEPHEVTVYSCDQCGRVASEVTDDYSVWACVA